MDDNNSPIVVVFVAMTLWGVVLGLFVGWLIWA